MSWAAGANRSNRVGEPPSKAEPWPSTLTRRSTCTANPSGNRAWVMSVTHRPWAPNVRPGRAVVDHLSEHPLPLCSGRGGRVTQYAEFADRRDTPASH